MQDTNRPVAVAILNWNGLELTRSCIHSLAGLSMPHHIFVVDNASDGPDAERLRSEMGVEVVSLPRNGGVAYGYNAAIRHAHECGHQYVLLLNNDVVSVDPLLLNQLVDAARDGSVAVASPLVLEEDGRVFSAGGVLTGWGAAAHLRSPRSSFFPYSTDWVDGSAMLVKVPVPMLAGLMSEEYFLYWEEVDWCWRLRRAGYRCVVVPTTKIVHLRGRTVPSELSDYYLLRNGLLFHRNTGSVLQNAKYVARFLGRAVPSYIWKKGVMRRSLTTSVRLVLRAVAWNVTDAIARRSWRRSA